MLCEAVCFKGSWKEEKSPGTIIIKKVEFCSSIMSSAAGLMVLVLLQGKQIPNDGFQVGAKYNLSEFRVLHYWSCTRWAPSTESQE